MSQVALLTGITGFIGEALARRLLSSGWTVHAIVRAGSDRSSVPEDAELHLHEHDGTTEGMIALFEATRPDCVFHLASLFLVDHKPEQLEDLITSNVLFPTQLLEAMAKTGSGRMVAAGTAWQNYESASYRPVNLYAATKQAFEDLLDFYVEVHGLSATLLKIFDTYGAKDKRRKLIRILLDAARDGQPLDMSPGDQLIDLAHVDDVADAFCRAAELVMEGPPSTRQTYFIPGDRLSVRELAGVVERVCERTIRANFGGRPYRAREVMRPIEVPPGGTVPGWRQRRTLEESLPALYEVE